MPGATSRSRASCAQLVPGLEIDWLAQDPVTRVLEARGRAHPPRQRATWPTSPRTSSPSRPSTTSTASRRSGAWTRSCARTTWSSTTSCATSATTCGSATRPGSSTTTCTRTRREKHAPFAWLTDFVGWLPMPDGGEREAFVAADYNAEMVEHVRDHPEIRDRAIFVGNPDDIVARAARPSAPDDPRLDRAQLRLRGLRDRFRPAKPCAIASGSRAELGYGPHEQVCIVTVGGSGVGATCCAG